MLGEFKIFRTVIERLNNNGIPYMVCGSVALNYYTQPRMTRDIDIVVEIKDSRQVYNLFKDRFYINLQTIEQAVNQKGMFNIIDLEEMIKIDFIVRKETPYRRMEFSRRVKVSVNNIDFSIVTLEDLIISKLLWAKQSRSELQLKDVANLLRENPDQNYIKRWVKEMGLEDLLKEAAGG